MTAPAIAPICPAHAIPAVLIDDGAIYGRSFGRLWRCPVTGCDRRVGAHPDGSPKGTLADEPTRQARMRAHAAFDGWWRQARISRGTAYRRLAADLGIREAHIGEMSVEQCERVIALYRE